MQQISGSQFPSLKDAQANRLTLPKTARELAVSPATVARWATRGVRGVRLRTFVLGGRRFTTPALIEEFMALSTAAASSGCDEAATSQTDDSGQNRRVSHDRAVSRLAEAGF